MEENKGEVTTPISQITTSKYLNKYEASKIIIERTLELNKGSPPYIETSETDSKKIAQEELRQRKLPYNVVRHGNNRTEIIKLSDLKDPPPQGWGAVFKDKGKK